jgi:hypothetical protein
MINDTTNTDTTTNDETLNNEIDMTNDNETNFSDETADDTELEASTSEEDEQKVDGENDLQATELNDDAPAQNEKAPKVPKEKAPPAHLAFIAAVKAHAETLGLGYKDQKGFAQFFNAESGHKIYVAKQGKAITRIDTTLPVLGQTGTYELVAPVGRITCHIDPDMNVVEGFLAMLADNATGKIPAPKKAAKAATAEVDETDMVDV